jgi:murein DD-endopeptidase MepM/ murein hydrolase activator NlpD
MVIFFKRKNNILIYPKPKIKIDYYFHVLQISKSGKTVSFRLHKLIPYTFISLLCISIVIIIMMTFYCTSLYNSVLALEKINYSNRNLKSEVEALTLKIKSIQLTMTQVESLSSKIQKASTRTDDRIHQQSSQNSEIAVVDNLGIGPLSKEDYELSQQLTSIKKDNLQLKDLFEEAQQWEKDSEKKLVDFKKLISDLRKYNVKLHLIPDIAPAKGRLSSSYGWRISPFSGKDRMHLGLDIAAPIGSPIYATADGTVVRTAMTDDYGRMLEIQHNNKLLTRYAHTSMIYVKEGQKVKKGDVIAAVGSTGRSTGPHVHYEIEVDGRRVDPVTYIVLW